jgi:signal transduction histidine kinase
MVNDLRRAEAKRLRPLLHSAAMDLLLAALAAGGIALAVGALVLARRARATARASTSARDVLEQEMRRSLEASEEQRLSASLILSSMEEGVVLFGPDGRATFANPSVALHLGTPPTSVDALLPIGLQQLARLAVDTGRTLSAEVEAGAPARVLRGFAAPAEDGSLVLVLRDITETRRQEQIRRDFVANASHELKTPAASIQAAAETIRTAAQDDPSVIPRFASQLEREAARLSRIVSDLLDLSRLESGSELDEAVAFDAIVRDESERFEDPATEAGVALSVAASDVPRVRGSARDLALLVRNLVDNAIRYTRPGGRVNVGLSTRDGQVVLTVEDTGLGIPTRDLPRIFERFYRVDRARSRETGRTGLGLSIVKHIVENHGGTVDVRSELGRGTAFEVRLPAAS